MQHPAESNLLAEQGEGFTAKWGGPSGPAGPGVVCGLVTASLSSQGSCTTLCARSAGFLRKNIAPNPGSRMFLELAYAEGS